MLIVSPDQYLGKLIFLKPNYGWGWHQGNQPIDYQLIDQAGGFRIRIKSFFSWCDELRGVIGTVEEANHLFDAGWIVCWDMITGQHNFTDKLCHRYDLEIGSQEPTGSEWPAIKPEGLMYTGHGVLAVSEARINTWLTELLEKV